MEALTSGVFLAAVNTAVVDYVAEPVRKRFPKADMWWLLYVALVTGFAISWFAGVNLFIEQIPNEVLGRVLSGLFVGGGSSLIHNVFDRPTLDVVELTAEIEPAE